MKGIPTSSNNPARARGRRAAPAWTARGKRAGRRRLGGSAVRLSGDNPGAIRANLLRLARRAGRCRSGGKQSIGWSLRVCSLRAATNCHGAIGVEREGWADRSLFLPSTALHHADRRGRGVVGAGRRWRRSWMRSVGWRKPMARPPHFHWTDRGLSQRSDRPGFAAEQANQCVAPPGSTAAASCSKNGSVAQSAGSSRGGHFGPARAATRSRLGITRMKLVPSPALQ